MKMSRLVAFSSSLLLGAVLALTGAATANAASSVQAVDYVALGDSYSSGSGPAATTVPVVTASAAPRPTPPYGRTPTRPRRSPSPPARVPVPTM